MTHETGSERELEIDIPTTGRVSPPSARRFDRAGDLAPDDEIDRETSERWHQDAIVFDAAQRAGSLTINEALGDSRF